MKEVPEHQLPKSDYSATMSFGQAITRTTRRLTRLGLLFGSIAALRAILLRHNEQRHGIGGIRNDGFTDA